MSEDEEIERAERELTVGEREMLAKDRELWRHLGAGAHLDEMLSLGPGLMLRRRLAMRMAFVNRPEGKGYGQKFNAIMVRDQFYDRAGKDSTARTIMSNIMWLHDEPERLAILREIRDAMTPGERARLNSPGAARQRVEAVLKARKSGTEETLRGSPVTKLREQLVEKDREIAHLKAQLAKADAGSLFDLKHDSAEDIGRVLLEHLSETKFEAVVKAAKGQYAKKKKAAQKPAG
jgi:hypothetical protein